MLRTVSVRMDTKVDKEYLWTDEARTLEMLESDDLVGIGMPRTSCASRKRPRVNLFRSTQHQLHKFLHGVLLLLRVLQALGSKDG